MGDDARDNRISSFPAAETLCLARLRRPLLARLLGRACRALRAVYWRRRLASFGPGSSIDRPAHVVGFRSIAVGGRVEIHRGARIEALGDPDGGVVLRIGDGAKIHPDVHIGAVRSVTIGRGALLAGRVYITDHDHDFSDPDDPPVSNRRVTAAPVSIGDYAWLGEAAMVLKGVTIGERSVVGAGSVVTRDVPPLSLALGAPARVVKRYDRARRAWVKADPP
ncbi:MAG: acyltransferase [Planctomycetota bacterium]